MLPSVAPASHETLKRHRHLAEPKISLTNLGGASVQTSIGRQEIQKHVAAQEDNDCLENDKDCVGDCEGPCFLVCGKQKERKVSKPEQFPAMFLLSVFLLRQLVLPLSLQFSGDTVQKITWLISSHLHYQATVTDSDLVMHLTLSQKDTNVPPELVFTISSVIKPDTASIY